MNESGKVYARVQKVFREVFEDDTLEVIRAMTPSEIPAWDSNMHIALILELEEEFGIEFTTQEMSSVPTVGDLLSLVEKKLETGR